MAIACFWDLHICQENFPVWVVCPRAGAHCISFWHLPVGGPAYLPHGDKPDTVHPARGSQVQERSLRHGRPTPGLLSLLESRRSPCDSACTLFRCAVFSANQENLCRANPCFLRTKKCNKARSLPTCQQPRRCSTVSVLPRGLMSPEEQCPSTLSLLTNCSQEPYPCSKVCHLAQDWEVNRAGTCLGALSSGKICPVFATTCPPVLAASCLCLPKFSSPWEVVAVLWP